MTQLAGTESSFTWTGTFLLVLLPGVLVGGLLGWAEALRQSGDIAAGGGWLSRRRCSSSPSPIRRTSPPSFKPEWGGALGVVLVGLLGGYALAPRGPAWSRVGAGIFAMAGIAAAAL
jgi:hypothetical protein